MNAKANSVEHRLDSLIAANSVAVIGASDDPRRIGGRPVAYMLARGFKGSILPVNPGRASVQGLLSYESVESLPYTPDTAVVAVSAGQAVGVVEALGRRGVGSAVVFSSGFAETGTSGERAQQELVSAARQYGMRLLGPNSLGLYNQRLGYFPTFSTAFESGWPLMGRIGIASQSGAFAAYIFTSARERRIGVPVCIMTGNEGDVTLGEAMQWLVHDPETDVVCAYAEGIRDPNAFIAALEAAHAARKPVVIMKTGRSVLGSRAAKSHTSSIAGNDAVFEAVLAEFGVVRARSAEEFLDIAHLATRRVYPVRNTLGVLTVSGGAGVLVSDRCEELDLPMPPMPEPAQARLKELVPFAAVSNPVDCTAQVFNDLPVLGDFAESIVRDGGYSSLLFFFAQAGGAPSIAPELRKQLSAARQRHPERLYVLSAIASPACVDEYEASGLTVFPDPTRAVNAIHAMGRFGDAFARTVARTERLGAGAALNTETGNEAQAKAWLAAAGIPITPEATATSADAAVTAAESVGYPVVLKILSADIPHKSDIGGVLLDLHDEKAVRAGFGKLIDRAATHAPSAHIDGVLVARQIRGAVECIMGIHRDPIFGLVVMFGLGGIFVELLKDTSLHRCPVDEGTAESMIRSVRGAGLLQGVRGQPRCDIPALARALSRLSELAIAAGPRLRSVDLNPVLALPAGKGCFAADALVEMDTRGKT